MPTSSEPAYKSHPIFFLRRLLIINAVIGLLLHIIALLNSPGYSIGAWIFGILGIVASGILAFIDLSIWAHGKRSEQIATLERERERERAQAICAACQGQMQVDGFPSIEPQPGDQRADHWMATSTNRSNDGDDDDKPKWPKRKIMIVDFILTGIMLYILVVEINFIPNDYYSYDGFGIIMRAYASVTALFSAVLHARSWWRAFRAREKQAWLRELGSRNGPHGWDIESGRAGPIQIGSERAPVVSTDTSRSTRVPAVSFTDLVGETAKNLSREARKAVTSKAWLGPSKGSVDRSDTKERDPLLPRTACSHHDHAQHVENGDIYGGIDVARNASRSGNASLSRSTEPMLMDAEVSYLTPSDSGVTSVSSGSNDGQGNQDSNIGSPSTARHVCGYFSTTENKDEPSTPNAMTPGHVAGSTTLGDDQDDDADIMVVKKSQKGRTTKGGKSRRREVGIEE